MKNYTARAALEFGSIEQWNCDDCLHAKPVQLPIQTGPFILDHSPNDRIYFEDFFGIDPETTEGRSFDENFPVASLYVDTDFVAEESHSILSLADKQFECFELLLRLFQPGDVSVRRHGDVRDVETGEIWFSWSGHLSKPVVGTTYHRPAYHVHDDIILGFQRFFNKYWNVLDKVGPSVRLALNRFNSSYERRDLVDRLIDLVIALEALFNDHDPGSVTYKVSFRCASWLRPRGEARFSAFQSIKRAYDARSRVVHARGRENRLEAKQVDDLEYIVRDCLVKFLGYQILEGKTPNPNEIDEFLLRGCL